MTNEPTLIRLVCALIQVMLVIASQNGWLGSAGYLPPGSYGYGEAYSCGQTTWSDTHTDAKPSRSAVVATSTRYEPVATVLFPDQIPMSIAVSPPFCLRPAAGSCRPRAGD